MVKRSLGNMITCKLCCSLPSPKLNIDFLFCTHLSGISVCIPVNCQNGSPSRLSQDSYFLLADHPDWGKSC